MSLARGILGHVPYGCRKVPEAASWTSKGKEKGVSVLPVEHISSVPSNPTIEAKVKVQQYGPIRCRFYARKHPHLSAATPVKQLLLQQYNSREHATTYANTLLPVFLCPYPYSGLTRYSSWWCRARAQNPRFISGRPPPPLCTRTLHRREQPTTCYVETAGISIGRFIPCSNDTLIDSSHPKEYVRQGSLHCTEYVGAWDRNVQFLTF